MPSRLPRTAHRPTRRTPPRGPSAGPDRRLREAQENLEDGGAAIMAMTYMGHLGVAHSREALAGEVQEMEIHGVPTGEALQGFQVRRLFHEIAAHTATSAVDTAAILYAHAVLSGVIDTLCAVSLDLDPEAWTDASAEPGKTPGFLPPPASRPAWLEHASLAQKCEALLRINRRSRHRDVLQQFQYSTERLRKLEQLRRRLVEPSSVPRKTLQPEEKVDDLLNTAQFFINLVAQRQAEAPSARAPKKASRTSQKVTPAPEPVWQQGELL